MDLNLILGALLGAAMIAFLLFIRPKDIPQPAGGSARGVARMASRGG